MRGVLALIGVFVAAAPAAAETRQVLLEASRFQGAPLQARFDAQGKHVVVQTLQRTCVFEFDDLFDLPGTTIRCVSDDQGRPVTASPSGSAIVTSEGGPPAVFLRRDDKLKPVSLALPRQPGGVVPIGLRDGASRAFVMDGPEDPAPGRESARWSLLSSKTGAPARPFDLLRPPLVSTDERTTALVQSGRATITDRDGAELFRLKGAFRGVALSSKGSIAAAWGTQDERVLAFGHPRRDGCSAPLSHGVRFVVLSRSGDYGLAIGDFRSASIFDTRTCAEVRKPVFEKAENTFIPSAVVDDRKNAAAVVLDRVSEGYESTVRLVRSHADGHMAATVIGLPPGGASANRPGLDVGREGRYVVYSITGVVLVRE